jgi:RNA-directed DNA polymerase
LQRTTLKLLQQVHSPRAPVHGFIKGRGAITNANVHQTRPYLLNLDLRNYFGVINSARVLGLLRRQHRTFCQT